MKYTPGPWDIMTDTLDPHDTYWIQKGRKTIACLFRVQFTIDEFQANARLIQLAPEMFKACLTLVMADDEGDPEWTGEAISQARAILYKAES